MPSDTKRIVVSCDHFMTEKEQTKGTKRERLTYRRHFFHSVLGILMFFRPNKYLLIWIDHLCQYTMTSISSHIANMPHQFIYKPSSFLALSCVSTLLNFPVFLPEVTKLARFLLALKRPVVETENRNNAIMILIRDFKMCLFVIETSYESFIEPFAALSF